MEPGYSISALLLEAAKSHSRIHTSITVENTREALAGVAHPPPMPRPALPRLAGELGGCRVL